MIKEILKNAKILHAQMSPWVGRSWLEAIRWAIYFKFNPIVFDESENE